MTRYQLAGLVSARVAPSEAFALTPAQVHNLYLHPRDSKGQLQRPRPPRRAQDAPVASLKRDLGILATWSAFMKPADYQAAVKKVQALWGAKDGIGTDGTA